jgi:CheY-like chemotaxis protein
VGYVVETVRNGAEALARVRDDGFAAIVLDLMMPGMSGGECLDACGDELLGDGIPVAVASAAHSIAADASWPAVSAVVSKPFDLAVLEAIVAQLSSAHDTGTLGAEERDSALLRPARPPLHTEQRSASPVLPAGPNGSPPRTSVAELLLGGPLEEDPLARAVADVQRLGRLWQAAAYL